MWSGCLNILYKIQFGFSYRLVRFILINSIYYNRWAYDKIDLENDVLNFFHLNI